MNIINYRKNDHGWYAFIDANHFCEHIVSHYYMSPTGWKSNVTYYETKEKAEEAVHNNKINIPIENNISVRRNGWGFYASIELIAPARFRYYRYMSPIGWKVTAHYYESESDAIDDLFLFSNTTPPEATPDEYCFHRQQWYNRFI